MVRRLVPAYGDLQACSRAGGGSYLFKVYIASLGSPQLYTFPADVPTVGGKPIGATLGYGVTLDAPLEVTPGMSPPLNGFAGLSLNFANLASVDRTLDASLSGGGWVIKATPQAPLDPTTLEMDGGFGVAFSVTGSELLAEQTFLDRQFFVGLFVADVGIKGDLKLARCRRKPA